MTPIREMSRCPHCGARGVKLLEPLVSDGYNCDVPYCGACGKNYPVPQEPEPPRDADRSTPTPQKVGRW